MPSVTQKTFNKGSEFPPLDKGVLRLYSMRFCPYAHRTRLVLAYKNIKHETVNVNLKEKPDWLLARNPMGMVPVLEQDDKVVYESSVCDDYLDDVFPENKLTPSDPYVKARHGILMETFGKVATGFFRTVYCSGEDKAAVIQDIQKHLQPHEDGLKGTFFGGDKPSMLDFHMFPWFERMRISREDNFLPAEKFPKLTEWTEAMMALPAVKETCFDAETHTDFLASIVSGKPDYDIGLGA